MTNPTDQAHQDRTELAQYRAIFAAISKSLETGAAAHLYHYDGKFGVRLSELDGQTDCTTVAVTGKSLRDAMAQASQVAMAQAAQVVA